MVEFLQYLNGEWKVIGQAPLTFLIALAIVAGIAWVFGKGSGNLQIANLQSSLDLSDRKVQDYKDKLEGKSPDEAGKLIEALEKRLALLEPKSLSADQLRTLESIVGRVRSSVSIITDAASPEAKVLAGQLDRSFRAAGWETVSGAVLGIGYPPKTGIGLYVAKEGTPYPGADLVNEAFTKVGLAFDVLPDHPSDHHRNGPEILLTTPQPV